MGRRISQKTSPKCYHYFTKKVEHCLGWKRIGQIASTMVALRKQICISQTPDIREQEKMVEQKLYKTRLCNLYQRGGCHRQNCSFAHGEAELRRFLHGSRQDHRAADLREKLDRRRSPIHSYSPERDRRGRRESYGDSPRSLRRDGKHRKKQHGDGHSDGSLRASEGTEDKVRDVRRASSESKEFLDEQLRKLQSDINLLDEHKQRLENYLDERIKEASSLNTKIQVLELQLSQEKDESRRVTSKIKKFVRAYNRQSRLEDELKRSRSDFERVCEQLGLDSYRLVDEDDPGFNLSDEEIPADNLRNQRNELQSNDSLSKKRPRVHTEVDELSLQVAYPSKGEMNVPAGKDRMDKTSRWNPVASSNNIKKAETNGIAKHVSRTAVEEHNSNSTKHASSDIAMISKGRISEPAVVFPSTSMAARAIDDFVDIVDAEEKIEMARTPPSGAGADNNEVVVSKFSTLPFPPLPPPPPLPIPVNAYAEHKGDDENVDIDGGGAEEETMEVDIV